MPHTIEDRAGLKVLNVGFMNRRLDPKNPRKELPAKKLDDVLVHASEISRYYGIPLQSIGLGDNRVPGIWELVHSNAIGLRIPYNSETSKRGDFTERRWEKQFDTMDRPIGSEEKVVNTDVYLAPDPRAGQPVMVDTDDGMYVRYSDLLLYAEANGWKKGGGRPKAKTEIEMGGMAAIIAQAVAAAVPAVLASIGKAEKADDAEPRARSQKQLAQDAWLAAGRPEPRDEWKAAWLAHNG